MTITAKQKTAISRALKQLNAEDKAGRPVTHGTNWQRCGEALGYTGTDAEERGRAFVDALHAGTVTVKDDATASNERALRNGAKVVSYRCGGAALAEPSARSTGERVAANRASHSRVSRRRYV